MSGWVGLGQARGSGFEQTWLQQVGHCADLAFMSRILVMGGGTSQGATARPGSRTRE